MTIVLVTHDHEEAAYLCDRVVLFEGEPGVVTRIVPVTLIRPRTRSLKDAESSARPWGAAGLPNPTPRPCLSWCCP